MPVAKSVIAASPAFASSAPNFPATSTIASGVPDTFASSAAVFARRRLLEHQVVVAQLQRIALQLQRHVIVGAERQLRDRIDGGASADRA